VSFPKENERVVKLKDGIDDPGNSRSLSFTMDDSNAPPRIMMTSSKNISAKRAQSRIHTFLDDFENRKGGDKTVTVRLQKLSQALLEERQHASEG
jgi:hypothetical protein